MRSTKRALLLLATLTLASGSLISPAQAATADESTLTTLTAALGEDRTGGAYRAADGTMIVNVTDHSAAAAVRAAGGTPRLVTRSIRTLNHIVDTLDPGVAGTAWSVDVATNQVVVDVGPEVTGAAWKAVHAATLRAAGAIRVERLTAPLTATISGGDAIYGGGYRCSLGFNVRDGSTYYFLTAGHCTDAVSTWYANSGQSTKLGSRSGSSFPGNDYGIVRYTNTSITISGTVGGQDITSAANAYVGESVKRSGSTTGTKGGTVTGLNATVHYSGGGGTVRGLIKTNVCAEPGDSGGPLYDGSKALGLTSGGSGNCSSGGTTYFQPVTEALAKYNVSVF